MRKLFLFVMTTSFLISCKKEKETIVTKTDYLPLKVGNYWVYKHFDVDSLGNETELSIKDSVIISRDTTINSKKYYILEGTDNPFNEGKWEVIDILRDSSGYVVNHHGIIKFAENNFTDVLNYKVGAFDNDTLYTLSYKMEKPDNSVTVPAGTFEVLNYRGTVFTPVDIPGVKNPRYLNTYFAKGVGKILGTYFYIHGETISEKRLTRFRVQE